MIYISRYSFVSIISQFNLLALLLDQNNFIFSVVTLGIKDILSQSLNHTDSNYKPFEEMVDNK